MNAPPSPCQLCDHLEPLASRNYGFDLCETCAAGYVGGRLQTWGAQVQVEEVERVDRNGHSFLEIRVDARANGLQPLIASFKRKGFGDRFKALLGQGYRTGDPLFDDTIAVETRTPSLIQTLMANDGFQSAVMALVSACGAFQITPGVIRVCARLDDFDLRGEVPLAVCAILRHIANVS